MDDKLLPKGVLTQLTLGFELRGSTYMKEFFFLRKKILHIFVVLLIYAFIGCFLYVP